MSFSKMNPLNKLVSLFQTDSNNNRGKKLMVQQKIFSSELNIAYDREELRKHHYWGTQTLNGYKRTIGKTVNSRHLHCMLLV